MKFMSVHNHLDGSLQNSITKADTLVERAKKLGMTAIAVSEYGNLSTAPEFAKACKDGGLKSILGCDVHIPRLDSEIQSDENRSTTHLSILAKNLSGWQSLMKLVSESNKRSNYYYKPRLDIERISKYGGNLICFSGGPGTALGNSFFADKSAYRAKSYEEVKGLINPNWQQDATAIIGRYQDIFGRENFFGKVELIDHENLYAATALAKGLRYLSNKLGFRLIAGGNSFYPDRESAADHRLILCSQLKSTFNRMNAAIAGSKDVMLDWFFKSNNYFVPALEDIEKLHEPDEIKNTLVLNDLCDNYDILCQPKLPQYPCENANEELRQQCREGWKKYISGRIPKSQQDIYVSRIQTELKVFEEANLAHYFLVVSDICRYAKHDLGHLLGAARGSAGGCLTSMLLGITDKSVDPVANGLTFERFYNAGRNTATRISMPDIDIDVPSRARPVIFKYIRNKYGFDKTAQISTFGSYQGKGALKEVLRVHEACSPSEAHRITKAIPGNDQISDDLQEMEEEDGESTSIFWALNNLPDEFREWCNLTEDGKLEGPYARYFQQAMRLEGIKRNQGVHAAGMIVSPVPLADVCPLVFHKKSENPVVGVEKNGCELLGLLKIDILVISLLDKVEDIEKLLLNGHLESEEDNNEIPEGTAGDLLEESVPEGSV